MAAKSRSELLDVTCREFAKLETLIETFSEEQALSKDDDSTSIKDVIAHRAHWIGLFFGWFNDGLAGKPVYFPAKGYKWNELKKYNAELRQQQSDLGWAEAVALLRSRYSELTDFIECSTDQDLYAEPMKGGNNHWTAGRWAEAAGASHFRSATKYIRSRLKSMAD